MRATRWSRWAAEPDEIWSSSASGWRRSRRWYWLTSAHRYSNAHVNAAGCTAGGNVRCIEADATRFGPEAPVDCVYLSYALTMIPDWFAAIDNALAMLKPGGTLGVVDFYVSRAHPLPGLRRHGVATRHFWPLWFGHDGVNLNPDHLPYLMSRTIDHQVVEERSPVPWMGGMRVPCYRFLGRKAG